MKYNRRSFVRTGGLFIAQKGPKGSEEVAEAAGAIEILVDDSSCQPDRSSAGGGDGGGG